MRAIWKGHIRFSLVTIPIRIYSATNSEDSIQFNQLHKEDMGRVGYEKKCKKCGKTLSMPDIVKGFEYSKDRYVIIESSDFEKVKLPSTRVIEIEGFIDQSEVDPTLYDTPYYVGPDGDVASKAYALLVQTLIDTKQLAVGRVVLRDREDIVILNPREKGMVLYKIRYPSEVRDINEIPMLGNGKADKDQLKLANTLVDTMKTSLDKIELKDRYKESIREVINAKVEGKEIVTPEVEIAPVIDLMAALKSSLNKNKDQKMPMEKAKGTKKTKTGEKQTKTRKQKQA
jgi:DNA end-binding protein Ku